MIYQELLMVLCLFIAKLGTLTGTWRGEKMRLFRWERRLPGDGRRLGVTLLSWHSVERSTDHWGDRKKRAVAVTPKPCLLKSFPWARNSVILHQAKAERGERFWWAAQLCLRLTTQFLCHKEWLWLSGTFSLHFLIFWELSVCCKGKERPSGGVSRTI